MCDTRLRIVIEVSELLTCDYFVIFEKNGATRMIQSITLLHIFASAWLQHLSVGSVLKSVKISKNRWGRVWPSTEVALVLPTKFSTAGTIDPESLFRG